MTEPTETTDNTEITAVAVAVEEWLAAGRQVGLAWPVAFAGFSSRKPGEVLAAADTGQHVGEVLGPQVTSALAAKLAALAAPGSASVSLIRLPVDEQAAAAAGLACGGTVTVALHGANSVPARFWRAVAQREPVVMVMPVGPGTTPSTTSGSATAVLVEPDQEPPPDEVGLDDATMAEARALLAGGRTVSRVIDTTSGSLVLHAVIPPPRLVVVGGGDLADALTRQAVLLGWRPEVVDGTDAAVTAAGGLGPPDGLVVLSHDQDVAVPALKTALSHTGAGAGPVYIGALGSRRTQAGRRERLTTEGVADAAIDIIHGPAGLDLGGRAPAEIALAICAEMQAVRSGRTAGSLREPARPHDH